MTDGIPTILAPTIAEVAAVNAPNFDQDVPKISSEPFVFRARPYHVLVLIPVDDVFSHGNPIVWEVSVESAVVLYVKV